MALLLLGDSQIGHVWRLVYANREVFRTSTFVSVLKDSQRTNAIGAITAQVTTVILSCFTNHLVDWLSSSTDARIALHNQVFQEIFHGDQGLVGVCQLLPGVSFFFSPPNIRYQPSWYPGICRVALKVIEAEILSGPPKLYLLPDFDGMLEPDGVHFAILDRIRFAKFLADEAAKILSKPAPARKQSAPELTHVGHGTLINGLTERVTQVEARLENLDACYLEEADNACNKRDLNRFIIMGLAKLNKPSQNKLRRQVHSFVQQLVAALQLDDIVRVRLVRSTASAVANVECRTVCVATSIKSAFATAVKSQSPPAFLGFVSISYCHSLGMRIRLLLLHAIAKRQHEREPNAICSMTSFMARPILRVGTQGKGACFLSYVDAVKGYSHLLTQSDLDRAGTLCKSMRGTLWSRFVVLDDDGIVPLLQFNPRGKRTEADIEPMDSESGPQAAKH